MSHPPTLGRRRRRGHALLLLAVLATASCSHDVAQPANTCTIGTSPVARVDIAVDDRRVAVTPKSGDDPVDPSEVARDMARQGVVLVTLVDHQPAIVVLGPADLTRVVLDGTTSIDASSCGDTDIVVATAPVSAATTVDVAGFDLGGTRLFDRSTPIDDDRTGIVAPVGRPPG